AVLPDAKRLLMNLLEIQAPMIAAVQRTGHGPRGARTALRYRACGRSCDVPGRTAFPEWPRARRWRACGMADAARTQSDRASGKRVACAGTRHALGAERGDDRDRP